MNWLRWSIVTKTCVAVAIGAMSFVVNAHGVDAAQSDLVVAATSVNSGANMYDTKVVVDKYGFIYVAGEFQSGSLAFGQRVVMHSDPAIADDVSTGSQIFVVKYSQTGVALWATKLYSNIANSRLVLGGLAVDNKDNLYIAGTTYARVKFGFAQFTPTSGNAGFIATIKTNDGRVDGGRLFNSGVPGDNGTFIDAIHVDASGSVYVTGSIRQNAIFTKPNGNIVIANPVGTDAFVAKLNNLLDTVWVSTRGATSFATGIDVESDDAGNVYVVGRYFETPEFDGIVMGRNGCSDDGNCSAGFLEKLNKDGQSQWIKAFGGTSSFIQVLDMAVSSTGTVFLTGTTNEITAPPETGRGAFGKFGYTGVPTFLASIDTNGLARWLQLATYATANPTAFATFESVETDRFGNVYASLTYQGSASFDGIALTSSATNGLLIKFSPKGERRWTRDITTPNALPAYDGLSNPNVAIYRDHVLMVGTFYGAAASLDLGTTTVTRGGDNKADLVVAKFEASQAMQVKSRNRNAVVSWTGMAVGSDVGATKYRVKVVGTKKRCVVNATRNTCRIRNLNAGAKYDFRLEILDSGNKIVSIDESSKILIGVQQKTPTVEQNRAYTAKELVRLSSKGRIRMVVESGGCAVTNKTLTATGAYGTECRVKFVVGKNGQWPKMFTSFDFFIL